MGDQSVKYQICATLVVNIYMFGFGVFEYWFSYYDYHARDYALPLGGLSGSIIFGLITNRFGRKIPLLMIAVLMAITYLLILCVHYDGYLHVYYSLFTGGFFGGGLLIIPPLWISEIASDRGTMSTTLTLSQMAGQLLLIVYTARYPQHFLFPAFFIVFSILFAILFYFLPETPLSLVKRNEIVKAEKSICFYQNICKTDAHQMESLKHELNKLKYTCADNDTHNKSGIQLIRWSNFTTKTARKALTIGTILVAMSACNVLNVTYEYAIGNGFYGFEFESSWYKIYSAMIVGALIATQLVDHIGRKILIIVSAIGSSLSLMIMCVYAILISPEHFGDLSKLIPLISVIMVSFFSSLGIQSLTFTVITEIMPENIKNASVSFCGALYWIFSMIVSIAIIFIGYPGVMLISAIACLGGAISIALIMPETRRKSHQEIIKSL